MPPEILQQFNSELTSLLDADNPQARSLLAFIRRSLGQYNLQDKISVIDIFVNAYLRGVEQLLSPSGKSIQHPKAWMRSTTLNVIREHARAQKKECQLSIEPIDESSQQLVDDSVIEENLDAVVKAFHRLNHDDRKLLELKYLQGMPWKDVRDKLGQPNDTLAALRKRGQRTLDKLRTEYHEIRPPVDRPDD